MSRAPLLVLVSCWACSACQPPVECGNWDWHPAAGELTFAFDTAHSSACFEVSVEDPQQSLSGIDTSVTVENAGSEDCLVALYFDSREPDPRAVPALSPAEVPPEQIAGLGTRAAYVNLARRYVETDREDLQTLGCRDPASPCWLTIVGCPVAGVSGQVSYLCAFFCDSRQLALGEERNPQGQTPVARQVW